MRFDWGVMGNAGRGERTQHPCELACGTVGTSMARLFQASPEAAESMPGMAETMAIVEQVCEAPLLCLQGGVISQYLRGNRQSADGKR